MKTSVMVRLGIMMFLQFFVWGAWYMTVGYYMLGRNMVQELKWVYLVGPIAAIVSPFFLGRVADRYVASERVLGALHLLGGIIMLCAPLAANYGANAFILLLLGHMLCYMPTLGLANTLAFHNIDNQEKYFPVIRVFGTIGWIVAAWVASRGLHAGALAMQFWVAGGAALALGVFCFFLPHTPAPGAGKDAATREDAGSLLRQRPFLIFIICTSLICIPLAAYFPFDPVRPDRHEPVFVAKVFAAAQAEATDAEPAGDETADASPETTEAAAESTEDAKEMQFDIAFAMSFGQVMEIIFILLIPLLFVRLGVKWMLFVGMLTLAVRYGLFSAANDGNNQSMVWAGILLYGICYSFIFVAGMIYVDKKCGKEIRGEAQGLLVMVTQGLGLGIGALIMGLIVGSQTPAAVSINETHVRNLTEQELFAKAAEFQEVADEARANINWKTIWLVACAAVLIVSIAFAILFHEDTRTTAAAGETAQNEPLRE